MFEIEENLLFFIYFFTLFYLLSMSWCCEQVTKRIETHCLTQNCNIVNGTEIANVRDPTFSRSTATSSTASSRRRPTFPWRPRLSGGKHNPDRRPRLSGGVVQQLTAQLRSFSSSANIDLAQLTKRFAMKSAAKDADQVVNILFSRINETKMDSTRPRWTGASWLRTPHRKS